MILFNEQNLKTTAYLELIEELKDNLVKNSKTRLNLYKEKIKLTLALNCNAISYKDWYYNTLQLNKQEQTLNTDFCVINSSLAKLKKLNHFLEEC